MDVASVLADAADQASDNYNDDFDDAEEPAEPTVKTSAGDILKSSAIEVAYEDAIDAKIASRTQLDKLSYERTSSSPTSPSKNALSSSARGGVNEDVKRKKEFQKYDDDDSDSKLKERERKNSSASGESSSRSYNDRADAPNNAYSADNGSDDADGDKDDDDDEGSEENGDAVLNAELLLAIYHGDIKKTNKLLDSGAHYFTRDRHRWTALMWACSGGHEEILETLLRCVQKRKLKPFVNAKDNITGWTALHIACMKGRKGCVEVLLKYGANKESRSFLKDTPLDCLNAPNADDRRRISRLLEIKSSASNSRRNESKGDS